MNDAVLQGARACPAAAQEGLADCDIHPRTSSAEDLRPYLSARWWNYWQTYGLRRRHGYVRGHPYPKSQPADGMRRDAFPPGGGLPGSDLDFMRAQYLDRYGVTFGVLNPLSPTGQGDLNSEFSAAMCAAANEWQVQAWTRRDARLKASILVPYEDGEASRAEIHRRAAQPDFVQVLLMSRTAEALGRRRYWPIYEAAVEHGLPVGIHVFGYSGWPATNTGWPSFYIEEMAEHETSCSALLTSMVMEGVFDRFPTLKVVMIEAGFAWLPALGWRLDRCWSRMRDELPHVRRPPSEYLRQHVWVTTQPMEEPDPPVPEHLEQVMEWIGWDHIMFASDYPHWDFDDPVFALPRLDEARRRAIRVGNARALYGFP
jgi:predicted TIM-barrel fold metal-dependent hydrolase